MISKVARIPPIRNDPKLTLTDLKANHSHHVSMLVIFENYQLIPNISETSRHTESGNFQSFRHFK